MRTFGHLINLSCKLHLDKTKSQARGQDGVEAKNRKQTIKARFVEKFNMRIEEPRPCGGTSTTGNTARVAFNNPSLLAEILELDVEMVKNFSLLLAAISTHFAINIVEFEKLCRRTNEIYMEQHGNIHRNVAVHKLLDHGSEIIINSILPPGFFSEEAAEAKNKHYRNDREDFARKTSRKDNMSDVFHRNLTTSDPKISALGLDHRMKMKKKCSPFSEELKKLLILDEVNPALDEDMNTEEQPQNENEEEEENEEFTNEVYDDTEYVLLEGPDYEFAD